jgi:hypothetical protein
VLVGQKKGHRDRSAQRPGPAVLVEAAGVAGDDEAIAIEIATFTGGENEQLPAAFTRFDLLQRPGKLTQTQGFEALANSTRRP